MRISIMINFGEAMNLMTNKQIKMASHSSNHLDQRLAIDGLARLKKPYKDRWEQEQIQ